MSFLSALRHLNTRTNQAVLLAQDGDSSPGFDGNFEDRDSIDRLPEPAFNTDLKEIAEDLLDARQKIMWLQWNQGIWASTLFGNVDGSILQFKVQAYGTGQNFVLQIERFRTHSGMYRMVVYFKPLEQYKHDKKITDDSIHQAEEEFYIEDDYTNADISTELDDIKNFMIQTNWREVCGMIKSTYKRKLGLALLFVNYGPDAIQIFKLCNPSPGYNGSRSGRAHVYNIFLGFKTDGIDSLYLEIARRSSDPNGSELGDIFRRSIGVVSYAVKNGNLDLSKLEEECGKQFDRVHALMGEARTPRSSGPL
jgi:hypothetical protein